MDASELHRLVQHLDTQSDLAIPPQGRTLTISSQTNCAQTTMALTFQDRLERMKELETDKIRLIEDLFAENERLRTTLQETKLRVDRVEAESNTKTRMMETNPFVSVLIDGDCMNFHDDLVKGGEEGGRQAAHFLRNAVTEYLRAKFPDLQRDVTIIIRVYANFRGLASIYLEIGTLAQVNQFQDFIRGFNMGHTFSDFVDAGNGKACADEKLKALFNVHLNDVHCKYVLFGASSDNDYARLLVPYSSDVEVRERIILLEGPPFAWELQKLADNNFHGVRFNKVFRRDKLPQKRKMILFDLPPPQIQAPKSGNSLSASSPNGAVSFPQNDTPLINNAQGSQYRASDPSPATQHYTSPVTRSASASWTHSLPSDPRLASPAIATQPPPTPSNGTSNYSISYGAVHASDSNILVNNQGQRVDERLHADLTLVKEMQGNKLCKNYHLRNNCEHGDRCTFTHGPLLQEHEKLALWIASRKIMCRSGSTCRDSTCVYGHHCPYGSNCKFGETCKFPAELHNVSLV